MFKSLIDDINRETISLMWKAVPEVQADPSKLQQAQKTKSRFDISSAKTQHADSTNMGYRGSTEAQDKARQQQADAARGDSKPQPVVVADEPGRNDHVKIQNMGSGEVKEIKWKYAKKMVDEEGWILVEK